MAELNGHSDFDGVVRLIEEARGRALRKVNEELVLLYFRVGGIVSERVAAGEWGDKTVGALADHINASLSASSGFTRRGLYRMKQFYEVYSSDEFMTAIGPQLQTFLSGSPQPSIVSAMPTQIENRADEKIVSAVPTQIEILKNQLVTSVLCKVTWTNHLEILSQTKSSEEKFFYLLHCVKGKWSMRDLRRQLNSGYFERSMLSEKVSTVLTQLPQGFFKDPYIFEFLDLPEGHTEKDLESALVRNLQKFILEIGQGFTYMGRQFRMQVGNKDYRTDLLFFHRDLQCLVLFELKIKEFEPEFLSKLNFYLEALDRDVKRPHEQPSIGVLLCKGKDTEVVEYSMARSLSPAMIADYETRLIPKKLLAAKLHQLAEELTVYESERKTAEINDTIK